MVRRQRVTERQSILIQIVHHEIQVVPQQSESSGQMMHVKRGQILRWTQRGDVQGPAQLCRRGRHVDHVEKQSGRRDWERFSEEIERRVRLPGGMLQKRMRSLQLSRRGRSF